MVLITGASGHLGRLTIDFLLKKGMKANQIVALVRDESKVPDLKEKGIIVRKGNYDDENSLVQAFAGVTKLLLISSSELGNRTAQHRNVVEAAKKAGVPYIAYTSFARKNETESNPIRLVAQSHLETEKTIKESGLAYTLFLNNQYMENMAFFLGNNISETGIFYPAGEGRIAGVTRDDMAEATAQVLVADGDADKEYTLSGTDTYSFRDIAGGLSELYGKPIAYISPEPQAYVDALVKNGVPEMYAQVGAAFGEAARQGEFDATSKDLETLLGRKPTTLKDYLKTAYGNH